MAHGFSLLCCIDSLTNVGSGATTGYDDCPSKTGDRPPALGKNVSQTPHLRLSEFILTMRLINTTSLQLKSFPGHVPPYAILSHTWGEEEVAFQDIEMGTKFASGLKGFAKIRGCCEQAVRDGYEWAWVDTCCIDKTSSSELSEAINSMYQWYKLSAVCYVYMEDVEAVPFGTVTAAARRGARDVRLSLGYEFSRSRWFKRGWTLQELIAPRCLEFYNKHWAELGTKSSLASELRRVTGIRAEVLAGGSMARCCMAERMSWAASRETTKVEDRAYSLMGIFDVNMPLLYGEGHRAFIRLQEEILRRHEDLSLLAWNIPGLPADYQSVLAPDPKGFTTVLPTKNPPLLRDPQSPEQVRQGISWDQVAIADSEFEALAITSRGILVTLLVDDPGSYGVPHGERDVLAWSHLIAEFDAPNQPPIMLCTLLRVKSIHRAFQGTISQIPDYMTADRVGSSRKLGLVCVSQRSAKSFTPKKFYLPSRVEVTSASTEWMARQAWSMQGLPSRLQQSLGYQGDLNVLTFRLGTAGLELERHEPAQLNLAEMRLGVYSVFIPVDGRTASSSREVLFSCSQVRRGSRGREIVDRFAVYFATGPGRYSDVLRCGCKVLVWTREIADEGLASRVVRALRPSQGSEVPFGDRSHLRLESGLAVTAAVKQRVRSVRENRSLVDLSLDVSVAE